MTNGRLAELRRYTTEQYQCAFSGELAEALDEIEHLRAALDHRKRHGLEPKRHGGGPALNKFASGQQFESAEYFRAESAAWVSFASAYGARAERWFPAHSPEGDQAAAEYADRMVALMRERF